MNKNNHLSEVMENLSVVIERNATIKWIIIAITTLLLLLVIETLLDTAIFLYDFGFQLGSRQK